MKKRVSVVVATVCFAFLAVSVYAAVVRTDCTVQEIDGVKVTLDCKKKSKLIAAGEAANFKIDCSTKEVKGNKVVVDCSDTIKLAKKIKVKFGTKIPEGC